MQSHPIPSHRNLLHQQRPAVHSMTQQHHLSCGFVILPAVPKGIEKPTPLTLKTVPIQCLKVMTSSICASSYGRRCCNEVQHQQVSLEKFTALWLKQLLQHAERVSPRWGGFRKLNWDILGVKIREGSKKGFIDLLNTASSKKKPPSQRERSIYSPSRLVHRRAKARLRSSRSVPAKNINNSVKQAVSQHGMALGPTLGSPESHARCPATGGGGSPPLLPFLDLTKTKNTNPLIPCKKFSNSSKKETKRWISLKDRDKWSISIHAKPFSQKSASWTIPKSHTGPVAFASFDSQLGRDGAMLTDSWLCNRLKQKETLESLDQRGRTHLQPLLWSSKMQNLRLVRLVHC